MNNIFDSTGKNNFLFLASVIAVLCEQGPITLDLTDIEKFYCGDISRIQYDIASDGNAHGSITFSLKDK